MHLTSTLTTASLLSTVLSAPTFPSTAAPLPLLLWHGLGDNYAADGINHVVKLAEDVHPGTFVYPIRLDEDPSGDRRASFFGNVTEQVIEVCSAIQLHPILGKAEAVDGLGFSQGGIFLRAYVERCNKPPVRNLVTFGSPHSGIREFAGCSDGDWLCKGAMALLRTNTWSAFVQSRLVPAQYYRSADPETGEPTKEYLLYSNLLADINNEREEKNEVYRRNVASLEKFVMYEFAEDTTVIPKESEWFAEVNVTNEKVVPLKERQLYKEDWLGLKKLDEKGGLILKTAPGPHMHLTDEVLASAFAAYFGPATQKSVLVDQETEGTLELR